MAGLLKAWREVTADVAMRSDLGEPVARQVTGHTARRSGAQWLARRGLPLWSVQFLGRWGSEAVRLYTAQAYAELYGEFSVQAAANVRSHAPRLDLELWAMVEQLRSSPPEAEATPGAEAARVVLQGDVVQAAVAAEQDRDTKGEEMAAPGGGRWVTNRSTGVTHETARGWAEDIPIAAWRTRCGWSFSSSVAVMSRRRPRPPFCERCFKEGVPGANDDDSSAAE